MVIVLILMKAESIKNELIEWLSKLDDKSLLTSLLQYKKSAEAGDWADNLTKEQIESLQRGLADLKNGSIISSKDFWESVSRFRQ
jgi:RNA polymerase-binding transcription factor DksA